MRSMFQRMQRRFFTHLHIFHLIALVEVWLLYLHLEVSGRIFCEMRLASLLDAPRYNCLSYTWALRVNSIAVKINVLRQEETFSQHCAHSNILLKHVHFRSMPSASIKMISRSKPLKCGR